MKGRPVVFFFGVDTYYIVLEPRGGFGGGQSPSHFPRKGCV